MTAGADVSEIAVLFVLQRAHDHARHAEATLELEAADPRIADLVTQARKLRKAIALRSIQLVEPGVVPIA